jgi:hypothetical protein
MRNLLYPKLSLALLPEMLRHAVLGGLLAGCYGILHDQITYSISNEYFTRLKFMQFHYLNFGLPPRMFVAEIGFLAAWWVGFFAAWFIARLTVSAVPKATSLWLSFRGFLIIFAFAFGGSVIGGILGASHGQDYSAWLGIASTFGIIDLPGFVRVAYIHNATYLGGFIGLIAALFYVQRRKKRMTFISNP